MNPLTYTEAMHNQILELRSRADWITQSCDRLTLLVIELEKSIKSGQWIENKGYDKAKQGLNKLKGLKP